MGLPIWMMGTTAPTRRLVSLGAELLGSVAVTRASGGATYDTVNLLATAANNTARRGTWRQRDGVYVGVAPKGEPQEINWIRNPGGEGGSSSLPEFWQVLNSSGFTRAIVDRGLWANGDPWVDMSFKGTLSSGGTTTLARLALDSDGAPASIGDTVSYGVDLQLISGVAPSCRLYITQRTAADTYLIAHPSEPLSLNTTNQRFAHTRTLDRPTVGRGVPEITFGSAGEVGQAYDFTIRISRAKIAKAAIDTSYYGPATGLRGPVSRYAHNGRLLVEGSRTNLITNSRAEGGSTTTAPTDWGSRFVNGLTFEMGGPVTHGGRTGFRFRAFGTASVTGACEYRVNSVNSAPAVADQTFAGKAYVRAVSGGPVPWRISADQRTSAGGAAGNILGAVVSTPTADGLEELTTTFTVPTGATTTAFLSMNVGFSIVSGQTYDVTFDLFYPQLELAPFSSTTILPPVGAPGTSTRAADTISYAASVSERATIVLRGVVTKAAYAQGLLYASDGGLNNRIRLQTNASGAVTLIVTSGGANVANITLGTVQDNTPFAVGIAWSNGTVSTVLNGGAVTVTAGAAPIGMTTWTVGWIPNTTMYGEISQADLTARRISDAELQRLTLPTPDDATPIVAPDYFAKIGSFTRASDALTTSATGSLVISATNTPRFSGTDRRLLVEGARTNLIADPRTIGALNWELMRMSVTGTVTGPDGIADSATIVQDTSVLGSHYANYARVSVTTGLVYTYSVVMKMPEGGRRFVQLCFSTSGWLPQAWANFDLREGVVGAMGSDTTRSAIRHLGDGWYLCEVTATADDTDPSGSVVIAPVTSGSSTRLASHTGAGLPLLVYCASVEQANFASSTPILPAIGSRGITTRAADVPSYSLGGTRTEGTLVGTFTVNGTTSLLGLFMLHDGTGTNRIYVRTAGNATSLVMAALNAASEVSLGAITPYAPIKLAFSWSSTGIAASINGGPVVTSLGAVFPPNTLVPGYAAIGAQQLFGEVGPLDLHPTRAPDAALPLLSSI
jgi:hypothetical protein